MGIGAGVVVGTAIKICAKRESTAYGIVGATFAIISCILGDFFTNIGFIGKQESMSFFDTLSSVDPAYYLEIAFYEFDFFSAIVYITASWIAYSLAKNVVNEKE